MLDQANSTVDTELVESVTTGVSRPLNWAKHGTDCFTCANSGQVCDRQRPQCNTCLDQGRECGGFSIPLSWDASRTLLGKSDGYGQCAMRTTRQSKLADSVLQPNGRTQKPKTTKPFRFVLGPSRKRQKVASDTATLDKSDMRRNLPDDGEQVEELNHHDSDERRDEQSPLETVPDLSLDDLDFVSGMAVPSMEPFEMSSASSCQDLPCMFDEPQPQEQFALPSTAAIQPEVENIPLSFHVPPFDLDVDDSVWQMPENTAYENSSYFVADGSEKTSEVVAGDQIPLIPFSTSPHRYDILITMYENIFCVLPLTSDMQVNPFRPRRQLSLSMPNLLTHSILALSCQHLNHLTGIPAIEAVQHRSKADNLLEVALRGHKDEESLQDVLDAILIMFTQDCTLSALGTWNLHFTHALAALNAAGGIQALSSPRVQSQVAMLVWWDATLALISRGGLTFDKSYRNRLLELEQMGIWSFYEISGCPGGLFQCLVDLADLAKQAEIAASMEWLTFNLTPVLAIEQKLLAMDPKTLVEDFQYITDLDTSPKEEEERFHSYQDRLRCIEAWRYALLLYIERVFKWDRANSRSKSISFLTRSLLDCVACCRKTSQTQKQLLLPVFLAGSETLSEDMQQSVREYCNWWAQRSRYYMFYSVSTVLEEVWSKMQENPATAWWGAVIDQKARSSEGAVGSPQFLFG